MENEEPMHKTFSDIHEFVQTNPLLLILNIFTSIIWLAGTKTAMLFGMWYSGQYVNMLFLAICIDNLKPENGRKTIFASVSSSIDYRVLPILDETKFAHELSLTCYQIEEQQWDCIDLKFTKESYNSDVLTDCAFVSGPGGQSEQVQSFLLFTESDHHGKQFYMAKIAIAWYPRGVIFRRSELGLQIMFPKQASVYCHEETMLIQTRNLRTNKFLLIQDRPGGLLCWAWAGPSRVMTTNVTGNEQERHRRIPKRELVFFLLL